ncbi:MAG TPA: SAM-dependent methyltransferase [Actinocrinis sp.]|nr:SAM-dependent methyltransferase [Actinocrinis sp.]
MDESDRRGPEQPQNTAPAGGESDTGFEAGSPSGTEQGQGHRRRRAAGAGRGPIGGFGVGPVIEPGYWEDDLPVRSSLSLVDTSAPHPWRMYNFLVGGKDNFQVDRDAAAELLKVRPDTALTARAVESFCARCVVELAGAGIRQFVQFGSAISVPRASSATARQYAPDVRFVYVAEDPVTLIHARAVLAEDNVEIIGGNFRDPRQMLSEPALNALVDLDEPCGFLLFGMLDFIADDRRARTALQDIYDRAAPGSYLAFMHILEVGNGPADRAVDVILVQEDIQLTPRHVPEIEKIIEGFELWDEQGLVPVTNWRPDPKERGPGPELADRAGAVGAVIVKRSDAKPGERAGALG